MPSPDGLTTSVRDSASPSAQSLADLVGRIPDAVSEVHTALDQAADRLIEELLDAGRQLETVLAGLEAVPDLTLEQQEVRAKLREIVKSMSRDRIERRIRLIADREQDRAERAIADTLDAMASEGHAVTPELAKATRRALKSEVTRRTSVAAQIVAKQHPNSLFAALVGAPAVRRPSGHPAIGRVTHQGRTRAAGGKPVRSRGSRRVTTGTSSSDDPGLSDGDADPPELAAAGYSGEQ